MGAERRSRRATRHAVNVGIRALAVLVALAALAVPAYAFWDATRAPAVEIGEQVSVPLPSKPVTLRGGVPKYRDGVIVLCYHNIAPRPGNAYTVAPRAFAAQMAALQASGFHTIDSSEFAAYTHGKAVDLPARPLLITFDDGTKGVWTYADQTLRRLHFEATSFLITGDVSHYQPYYLTWPEVEAMNESGRWSFGSHTDHGHGYIPIDEAGREAPFLTNEMWLRQQRRLETAREYETRVSHDLDRSISRAAEHGLPHATAFAFPFSAVEPSNDSVAVRKLRKMLKARFLNLFDNRDEPTMVRAGMSNPLPRVEVFRGTDPGSLLRRVKEAVVRGQRRDRLEGPPGAG